MDEKDEKFIESVVNAFYESGFIQEADRLSGFKAELVSGSREIREQAAAKIIGFCHPKAWGDLAVYKKCDDFKTIGEWDNALARLSKIARHSKPKNA